MRAPTKRRVAPPAELPRVRALVLFGAVGLLFVILLGRSLYLPSQLTTILNRPRAIAFWIAPSNPRTVCALMKPRG
jgi:hypothetical protein